MHTAHIQIADTDDATAGDRVRIVNPESGRVRRIDEYPARFAWRGAGWLPKSEAL